MPACFNDRRLPRNKVHNDRKWRKIARARRAAQPFCVLCLEAGRRTHAVHTHHLEPVRGSKERLYKGKTINLCLACHSAVTALERKGINPYERVSVPRTDENGRPTEEWLALRAVKKGQRRNIERTREARRSLNHR